jgi:hypothetical protein
MAKLNTGKYAARRKFLFSSKTAAEAGFPGELSEQRVDVGPDGKTSVTAASGRPEEIRVDVRSADGKNRAAGMPNIPLVWDQYPATANGRKAGTTDNPSVVPGKFSTDEFPGTQHLFRSTLS